MIHLFLNGDFAPPLLPIGAGDFCIAVDGGIRHIKRLGLLADVWLGDFDSSEQSALFAKMILTFPPEKDLTDWELALAYVREHYPHERVQVVGVWGEEVDHVLSNFLVLVNSGLSEILLVTEHQQIWFLAGQSALSWETSLGAVVSIVPLTPLEEVNTEGLQWELQQAKLLPFLARSCRNRAQKCKISISWQQGAGLVILPRPAQSALNGVVG
ncbi:MAG: thiamine diphosphokinase [Cardiobacteriaceae bacterium]|nr:thiamine diphosphokinase [Cardiobacteriaceae bacterium]